MSDAYAVIDAFEDSERLARRAAMRFAVHAILSGPISERELCSMLDDLSEIVPLRSRPPKGTARRIEV